MPAKMYREHRHGWYLKQIHEHESQEHSPNRISRPPPTRTAVLVLNPPSRTAYIQALKKILWASSSAEKPTKNQKVNFSHLMRHLFNVFFDAKFEGKDLVILLECHSW